MSLWLEEVYEHYFEIKLNLIWVIHHLVVWFTVPNSTQV